MFARAFWLSFVVGVSLAFLTPACGTRGPQCSRALCDGCCDANQDCQTGTANGACGAGGRVCMACPAGQSCTGGVCVGAGGAGGGSAPSVGGGSGTMTCANCAGCCENGACRPGNAANACGLGGLACQNCQSQGRTCDALGRCASSGSCSGCLNEGACAPGTSSLACGSDGGVCRQCASNEICERGRCTTPTSCNASNCGGCCDGATCVQSPTAARCGLGGGSCRACSAPEQCISGVCMNSGSGGGSGAGGGLALPCNTITCIMGCCDGAGVCQLGNTLTACGIGGQACRTCQTTCIQIPPICN